MIPPDHVHISERESDGSWEDCLWDTALEWYRLCVDARKPATHAEAQLVRRASGEPATGGSNMGDLTRGLRVRYGYILPARLSSFAALRTDLTPGKAAIVQGSMSAFGSTHRLSAWLKDYNGGHAVHLLNIGGTLLWCDPLAPPAAAVPVEVSWADVASFVRALPGGEHVVGTIKNPPKDDPMEALTSYLPGYKATVKPTANVRAAPTLTATVLRVVDATPDVWTIFGTVKGAVDPDGGSDQWYVRWFGGRYEYTAKSNVTSVAAPVTDDGYTKATQDAAVAAETARMQVTTVAQAKIIAEQKVQIAEADALRTALQAFIA